MKHMLKKDIYKLLITNCIYAERRATQAGYTGKWEEIYNFLDTCVGILTDRGFKHLIEYITAVQKSHYAINAKACADRIYCEIFHI